MLLSYFGRESLQKGRPSDTIDSNINIASRYALSTNPFKVQAVARLLATTTDTVRRMVDESGIEVTRQETGPRTRMFSVENIFELARYRANRRGRNTKKKQVVATVYAP